jgi:hypothetical protein
VRQIVHVAFNASGQIREVVSIDLEDSHDL